MIHQERLIVTTIADGSGSVDGPTIMGWLYAIQWIDGDLVDGIDAVLSCVHLDLTRALLTLSNANVDAVYYPREDSHTNLGGSLADASQCALINGVLRLAITSGGAVKTGGCIVYWFD